MSKRQRCGLVVAATGMGKSHLATAARRFGGLGAEVAVFSLAGLPDGEWLELLLDRLPLDPASRAEPLRPWLKLKNRLRENMLLGRPTVLVFDDIDRGPSVRISSDVAKCVSIISLPPARGAVLCPTRIRTRTAHGHRWSRREARARPLHASAAQTRAVDRARAKQEGDGA